MTTSELIEIRNLLDGLRIGQDRLTADLASFRVEVLDRFDRLEKRVEMLEIQVRQLQQAVLENRRAIEENRKAIEENRKAIEENREAIQQLQVEVHDVRQTLNRARMDRRVDDQRIERLELRVGVLEERLGLAE